MGVIYDKNADWELIHEAYGTRIEGIINRYEWYDGRVTRVITNIKINGRQFDLYAHCIEADKQDGVINMEDDQDALCWYFAHIEKEMDDWDYERFWTKEYWNGFWRGHTRQRKLREEQQEWERKAIAEKEAQRQERIADFQIYAEKKKLRMIIADDNAYFIKINKRIHKNADEVADDLVLMFAKEHPGNGVEIVETREVG